MGERRTMSALTKERFLLDELDQAAQAELERAFSAEQQRELVRDDAELRAWLFARVPPARLAERVSARAQGEARPQRWAFPALAAALVLLGVLFVTNDAEHAPWPHAELQRGASSLERAKGLVPAIHVYRRRSGSAERLDAGAVLRAHDLLQLGYVAAGRKYGVLVSIDGAGQVTLHHPAAPELDSVIEAGSGERLLPSAYEIDAAPDFERFFWVVSPRSLAVTAVLAAARELARDPQRAREEPLRLPPSTEQFALTFRKESP
jgi:hypothetical protein